MMGPFLPDCQAIESVIKQSAEKHDGEKHASQRSTSVAIKPIEENKKTWFGPKGRGWLESY